jgi:pantoate/beta-alanine ligase
VGIHAVSAASRERAQVMVPGVPLASVDDIVASAELVILAVPDDALAGLVSGVASRQGWRMGQIVLHTSGSYGLEVLAPAAQAGAITAALHPVMTFSGTSLDLPRLIGCPMAVAAAPAFLPIVQALAVELGGEPFSVIDSDRPVYHAALAHSANHLVTLVTQAMRTLNTIGIEDAAAVLRPLLSAALERALNEGEGALTGPISRGDVGTVSSHLNALDSLEQAKEPDGRDRDIPASYRALARATTQRCEINSQITPEVAQQLYQVIDPD